MGTAGDCSLCHWHLRPGLDRIAIVPGWPVRPQSVRAELKPRGTKQIKIARKYPNSDRIKRTTLTGYFDSEKLAHLLSLGRKSRTH